MNINAGGLQFNNTGTIISAVSGNNKRSFNARGIDLAQNLTSVAGQDITLIQKGEIAAKTSGEGAGIVVRGVVSSGHDFIVDQNGLITSAYLGNAYGYQQIGTVNAANNVKISNKSVSTGPSITTYFHTYNFGSAYGVYMNNAITAGGDVNITNDGNKIESSGTGAIGIQTQAIVAKGAVTIFNNSPISLQPKSSNPVQLSAYGILLNGNITAGSDININNGVLNEGEGATFRDIFVKTTPDTSFVRTAGVGSAALINLTSNFGGIKVGNYHTMTFLSTSQTNNSLRGVDLNANLVTGTSGQDVTITNRASVSNEGGNGDTTGIYLQGSINSKGNIVILNSSPPKYNYVESFYGSAAGIVVAGLNATGNISISNGTAITANKRSSAISNIEAFGVKLTGLVKADGSLSVENSGEIKANTLGQPAASYAAYGIEILGGRNISVTAATIDLRNSGAVSAIDANNNSISNINAAAYGIDIAANMTTTAGDIPAYQSTPLVPSININVPANGNSPISAYGKAYGVNITGSLNSAGQIYANVSVSVQDKSASTSKDNLLTGAAYGIVSTGSLTAVGGVSLLVNETASTNQISSVHGSATGISQTGAINAGNGVTEIVGGLVTANVTNATGILSSGGITSLGGAVKVKTTAVITGVTSAAGVLLAPNVQSSYNSRTRRTTYFTLPVVTSAGDISINQSGAVTASAGKAYGVSADIMNSTAGNISITQNGAVTGAASADGVVLASANAGKAAVLTPQYTTSVVRGRAIKTFTGNLLTNFVSGSVTVAQIGDVTATIGNATGVTSGSLSGTSGVTITQNGDVKVTQIGTSLGVGNSTSINVTGDLTSSNNKVSVSNTSGKTVSATTGLAYGINLGGTVTAGNAIDTDASKVSSVGITITQNATVTGEANSAYGINANGVTLASGLPASSTSSIEISNNGAVTATQSLAKLSWWLMASK